MSKAASVWILVPCAVVDQVACIWLAPGISKLGNGSVAAETPAVKPQVRWMTKRSMHSMDVAVAHSRE